jgi:glutathione peroxidase-family protein
VDADSQEPGTAAEIEQFTKKEYGVTFPVLAKVRRHINRQHHSVIHSSRTKEPMTRLAWLVSPQLEVNGPNTSEFFQWLKRVTPHDEQFDIQWNFAKCVEPMTWPHGLDMHL